MKYAMCLFMLATSVFSADTPPSLANTAGVVNVSFSVDIRTEIAASRARIQALPVGQRAAALAKEKIELEKLVLSRGQSILAKAETAAGMNDVAVDAEVAKVTNEVTARAAALKAARASGEIDPNN